jgi:hypothetical protein
MNGRLEFAARSSHPGRHGVLLVQGLSDRLRPLVHILGPRDVTVRLWRRSGFAHTRTDAAIEFVPRTYLVTLESGPASAGN